MRDTENVPHLSKNGDVKLFSMLSGETGTRPAYPIDRKILLVASGVSAIFLGTDFLTFFSASSSDATNQAGISAIINTLFILSLGLLWFKASYAMVGTVIAMITSVVLGEYLLALLIVPVILGIVVLTETRKMSITLFAISLAWAASIVVARPLDVGFLALLVPLLALAFFFANFIRRVQTQREADRIRLADMRRKQQEAVDAERKAIARDLHDIVAHDITVISMQAKAAEFSGDPVVAQAALKVIGATSKEALQDLRVMLNVLRSDGPATRVDGSLVDSAGNAASSLEILIGVEIFAERLIDLGHPTHVTADPRLAGLPQSAQAALYRVLQESTTNIVKHSGDGAACRIEALSAGDRVWLEVANQLPEIAGRGVFASDEHSSGIAGMTDRMAAFGGTLSAKRHRGDWVVRAELPASLLDSGRPRLGEVTVDTKNN